MARLFALSADFRAFTATHALVLLAFVVFAAVIITIGFRVRGSPTQRAFERTLGVAGIVLWIIANGYGALPGVFRWNTGVPLHICDLAALVAPIVMLKAHPREWQRAMLYFGGIGLCTQAFITPTLQEGPADPQFWFFWGGHYVILCFALYDLAVRRWRPTWRHWAIAGALSLGYLAVMLPIDVMFDLNYGFVGPRDQPGTMLEVLGPWPARVGILVSMVGIAFTVMMLPWLRFWRAPAMRVADERA